MDSSHGEEEGRAAMAAEEKEEEEEEEGSNPFEALPDDLLLSIFVCLSSTATAPSDLLAARGT
jgi:hypothetical protein